MGKLKNLVGTNKSASKQSRGVEKSKSHATRQNSVQKIVSTLTMLVNFASAPDFLIKTYECHRLPPHVLDAGILQHDAECKE